MQSTPKTITVRMPDGSYLDVTGGGTKLLIPHWRQRIGLFYYVYDICKDFTGFYAVFRSIEG